MVKKESRGYMLKAQRTDYETPQWLFDVLDDVYFFTLDAAADHYNAKCLRYYTEKENGLVQSWKGERVFLNPPYGKAIADWVKKAVKEILFNDCEVVVALLPARTDVKWFHDYVYRKGYAKFIFLKGRLKFSNWDVGAPFPSIIVVFSRFSNELSKLEKLYKVITEKKR